VKLFKELTPREENEFRAWARREYVPLTPIKGIWHPVVQDECVKMNAEAGQRVAGLEVEPR
jgi:hypothetical protein